MIEYINSTFKEDNQAVKTVKIVFFGITIFKARITSTNAIIVGQLTANSKTKNKIGFK